MSKSTFNKGLVRSIKDSLGRFLGIAIIAALGAGFFAGLRMTGPDMRLAEDQYFDQTNMFDLQVISTLGLDDDEIKTIASLDGIDCVMPSHEVDALSTLNGSQYTVCIHELDVDAARASDTSSGEEAISGDRNYINRPILVDGRWPDSFDECVVSADAVMDGPMKIGDSFELLEGSMDLDKTLTTKKFKIVGTVRSPYYVETSTLGTTMLANGILNQYLYVGPDAFTQDLPYAKVFLTLKGARELNSTSDEYQDLVDEVATQLKDLEPVMSVQRLNAVKQESQDELDEQKSTFESEKADVLEELNDAKLQLDNAAMQLEASKAKLDGGESDYNRGISELQTQQDNLSKQIAQGREQVEAGRQQYHDALDQRSQLSSQLEEVQTSLAQVQNGIDIYKHVDVINQALSELERQQAELPNVSDEIAEQITQLTTQRDALEAQLVKNNVPPIEQLEQTYTQLSTAHAQLSTGIAEIDKNINQLSDDYFDQQLADINQQEAAAQIAITDGYNRLQEARNDLDNGWEQYTRGMSEYESNLASYEDGVKKAYQEFNEVQGQLDSAQNEIDSLEKPDWFVLDRTQNVGAASHASDASRMDKIATFFPGIFFLVAALVSLTCMTRMVDEERILIGTYKALGYSDLQISSKYLAYAFLASASGGIIGLLVLTQFLPYFIMNCYGIIYAVPPLPTPIDVPIALASVGLSVVITVGATAIAVASTLRETPAALMLPRAPKAGKRIFLERVKPLWEHMSFSWKVTCRNLFRYKRRFFMATIGIAGCTALLLTGFGLRDAINDIIDIQFGQIFRYSMNVTTRDDISLQDLESFHTIMNSPNYVKGSTQVATSNLIALGGTTGEMHGSGSDDELRVELIVPKNTKEFSHFLDLRERKTHKPLSLDADGVVLSEKTAKLLNVNVGDTFTLYEQNVVGNALGEGTTFTVGGITENYVSHFIYMDAQTYRDAYDLEPHYATTFAQVSDDVQARDQLDSALMDIAGVKMVNFNDESIDSYRTMLKTVDSVVLVLLVAAAALAFVVLYNLTNINISERAREIATLKVLGFTPHEVDAYIFRETILLSLIGGVVGLGLGIILESFVVLSVEVDMAMFGRTIHALSFILSFGLTMFFSTLVSAIMRFKLKAIDMVSSLKSVE